MGCKSCQNNAGLWHKITSSCKCSHLPNGGPITQCHTSRCNSDALMTQMAGTCVRWFPALWWLPVSLRHNSAWYCHAPASLYCNDNHNWNILLTVSKNYVVCGEVSKESHCNLAHLFVVIWLQPWWVILKIAPLKQYIGSCWCTGVFYFFKST